jgi:hypothetical protein
VHPLHLDGGGKKEKQQHQQQKHFVVVVATPTPPIDHTTEKILISSHLSHFSSATSTIDISNKQMNCLRSSSQNN